MSFRFSIIPRSLTRTLNNRPTAKLQTFKVARFPSIKTMATLPPPPPGKYEWLVVVPDQPGKLAKRVEVRPTHFAGLSEGVESGFWKVGGAILEDVPKEGEALKFLGSAMVCVAASKEEVLEKLKKDIYAKSEVWDFEKIQIYPFKCAFRYE